MCLVLQKPKIFPRDDPFPLKFWLKVKIWLKIALNAVRLPRFEPVNGISSSQRKIMVKDLR